MVEWLYLAKGQNQGPITSDSIKTLAGQGVLAPWTPVKRLDGDAASDWRRAGEVKGLFAGDVSGQLGDDI